MKPGKHQSKEQTKMLRFTLGSSPLYMHNLLYLRSYTKDELRNRNRLYWLVVQSVVNSSCIQDQKVYKNVQQRTL